MYTKVTDYEYLSEKIHLSKIHTWLFLIPKKQKIVWLKDLHKGLNTILNPLLDAIGLCNENRSSWLKIENLEREVVRGCHCPT